jgi:hypothetical protein
LLFAFIDAFRFLHPAVFSEVIPKYSELLKEQHHRGSDGAALANFLLFQEFSYKA